MGAMKRVVSFGAGGVLGALVGAAVAQALAPQSGEDLKRRIRGQLDTLKAIGDEAQARTEAELIDKYRADTDAPMALQADAQRASLQRAQALESIGLSASGQVALDAQDALERARKAAIDQA